GASSAPFTVRTAPVRITGPVVITAAIEDAAVEGVLIVLRSGPASVVMQPLTLAGGTTAMGQVTLSESAPPGGLQVALTSSQPAVLTLPASVTVPAGATRATFAARASNVPSLTPVTVATTFMGFVRLSVVTVLPVDPSGRLLIRPLTSNDTDDDRPRIN